MPTLEPHVLAIDDDADMRQLIADYLGQNDLRVTTVATGADMEKALAEHAITGDDVAERVAAISENESAAARMLASEYENPCSALISSAPSKTATVISCTLKRSHVRTRPAAIACGRASGRVARVAWT